MQRNDTSFFTLKFTYINNAKEHKYVEKIMVKLNGKKDNTKLHEYNEVRTMHRYYNHTK